MHCKSILFRRGIVCYVAYFSISIQREAVQGGGRRLEVEEPHHAVDFLDACSEMPDRRGPRLLRLRALIFAPGFSQIRAASLRLGRNSLAGLNQRMRQTVVTKDSVHDGCH